MPEDVRHSWMRSENDKLNSPQDAQMEVEDFVKNRAKCLYMCDFDEAQNMRVP